MTLLVPPELWMGARNSTLGEKGGAPLLAQGSRWNGTQGSQLPVSDWLPKKLGLVPSDQEYGQDPMTLPKTMSKAQAKFLGLDQCNH
jgi:hypothetical protein